MTGALIFVFHTASRNGYLSGGDTKLFP